MLVFPESEAVSIGLPFRQRNHVLSITSLPEQEHPWETSAAADAQKVVSMRSKRWRVLETKELALQEPLKWLLNTSGTHVQSVTMALSAVVRSTVMQPGR